MSPTATSIGDVFVNVVTDTSGLEDSLTEALERGFGRAKLGTGLGITAIGAGIAAVVREFAPLEAALLRIAQLEGLEASPAWLEEIAQQVTDVADEVGLRAEPIGAAVAAGIGRGFSREESLDLAKLAGDLSVAVGSEVAPAINAITGVLNSYDEAVLNSADATEILLETVTFSNVPLAELSRQLGNITPSAATAGVSLAEIGAAFSTMTSQGLTAAESTTQLRTLFTELNTEAQRGAKVFKAISGKSFPDFIKAGGSMQDAVNLIARASEEANVPISGLFGNVNSGNAVMALTGASADRFAGFLDKTTESTGRLQTAVDNVNQGALRQFQDASAGIDTALDRIGVAIRPLTQEIITQLVRGMNFFSEVLNKVAAKLATVDWTPLISAVRSAADLFARFGPVILAVVDAIFAIDWAGIGNAIKVGFAPLAIVIPIIVQAVVLLANAFATYLVPAINAILPFITPVVAAFSFLFGMFATSAVIVATIGFAFLVFGKILLKIKLAIALVRGAWMALTVAFAANPIGVILIALAALAVAFMYAWKNSEKFRDIVRKAFVATAEGVGAAINAIISLASMWVKAYLYGFKAILDGLGKLPDWLGGGKFDDASAAVQRIIDGVNSIENSLHGLVDTAVDAARALAAVGASGGVIMSRAGQLPPGALLMQKRAAAAAKKSSGGGGLNPNLGALDDVLNPKKDDKAAKKAAEAAKKRLREMLSGIFEAVQKLAKNIGDKSLSSIQSGFDSLIGKYTDAIAEATEQGNKTVAARLKASLKQVKGFEKTLEALAKKRDAAIGKLDAASAALKKIKDEAKSFSDTLKAAFVNIGSVATATAGIDVSFRGIRNNLRDAIRTATSFDKAMRQLQTLNLNPQSLRQLAEAGPAALEQAQALARSGATGIAEINKLQAELDKMAGQNAKNLTNEFFAAGVSAAAGLVKGLQSQRDAIVKEMEKIAAAMVKAVKQGLKIHSPSQVFDEEIGRQIPAGMAQGVRRGTPDVLSALKQMTGGNGVNINGGINVTGVSDPAAAKRAGILAGEGIRAVLDKRATAQTLAGVR